MMIAEGKGRNEKKNSRVLGGLFFQTPDPFKESSINIFLT
jgi:hypothetical protein